MPPTGEEGGRVEAASQDADIGASLHQLRHAGLRRGLDAVPAEDFGEEGQLKEERRNQVVDHASVASGVGMRQDGARVGQGPTNRQSAVGMAEKEKRGSRGGVGDVRIKCEQDRSVGIGLESSFLRVWIGGIMTNLGRRVTLIVWQ